MGILSRMSTVVKSKMNRILDNAEDPRETLDYAYDKQMETLQDVKRGLVGMVTAKRRLELQAGKVKGSIAKLDRQARQAMAAGREDIARRALQRKQASLMELEGLDQQIDDLESEQEKLAQAERRLQGKVAAFRTRKEVIKAQYNAAQAQVRIGSALSGISEEMSDVSLAIERAEHKTEDMRAKSGAIDELVEVIATEDEETFKRVIKRMLGIVRENGSPVPVDEIVESDLVLLEPGITLTEAEEMFVGEGLLPG